MAPLAAVILFLLGLAVAVLFIIYVLVPFFAILGRLIRHILRFIGGMIGDVLRSIGAVLTSVFLAPLVVGSVVIGRWSAAAHFGRAIQNEIAVCGHCLYRLAIGHPARLLGLSALTEGIEHRIPEAMAKAPGSDKPSKRTGQFDGYQIVGSLPGGGSGAKIYVAEPDERRLAIFSRSGHVDIDQVVIKSFSVHDGSSLPQIIRESRALEAAKKLGLVLDHELNEHRFYYVMPYVPGDDLTTATRKLHDASGPDGLGATQLAEALGYVRDLLTTLDRYHEGGLWHKDVKPDNIIVHKSEAHLVDLGLVTPMRSAMTLTTHGTEYFRDPEMVRMALRGVKVHEVDGAKFDIYAAGAVLYSLVENSFPAHGGLSQVSKRCPDALRLVIRRAMSDYNSRYPGAPNMLADLHTILSASDPHTVKPADLPSMRGESPEVVAAAEKEVQQEVAPVQPAGPAFAGAANAAHAATPRPPQPEAEPAQAAPAARVRPKLRVTHWWTGRYDVEGDLPPKAPSGSNVHVYGVSIGRGGVKTHGGPVNAPPRRAPGERAPAHEQRERARARAQAARTRAHERMHRRLKTSRYNNKPNSGVFMSVLIVAGIIGGLLVAISVKERSENSRVTRANAQIDGVDGREFNIDFDDDQAAREIVQSIYSTLESVDEISWDDIRPRIREILQTASRSASATAALPPAKGELLLIDDLQPANPELRRRVMGQLEDNARSLGYDVINSAAGESATALIAEARATLGTPPADPDDPTYRQIALDWLRSQPRDCKGIVRLYWNGPAGASEPAVQVFPRGGIDGAWLGHQLKTSL